MIIRWLAAGFVWSAAFGLPALAAADDAPRVRWIGSDEHSCVEVIGLDARVLAALADPAASDRLKTMLSIHIVEAGREAPIAVLGRYSVVGDRLRLTPRFPLDPALAYRAVLVPRSLGTSAGSEHESGRTVPPAPERITVDWVSRRTETQPPTRVVAMYPSCDAVPENLLRVYIQFSAPMSRGEAYRRIHLLDQDGREVDAPFLELQEELWTPDQTRFTLLFDPGRIKRGLVPNLEMGTAIRAGKSYTLKIDAAWIDGRGRPLERGFTRRFHVLEPDRASPEPKRWAIDAPPAGSKQAIVVRFPEPLDHALLERVLVVQDGQGKPIPGIAEIAEGERIWRFVPKQKWLPGRYRLAIGLELEDLAGNSVARPFEVDEFAPITARTTRATFEREFEIRPR